MFNFAECADKCLDWPWRFPTTGGYKLVTQLSMYTSCILYGWLTAVYLDTDILTSDCVLLLMRAASYACCFLCVLLLMLAASGYIWPFRTVRAGSYFWLLHLQHCGGLSGVCIVVVSQRVAYWMKCLSFCSIPIHLYLAVLFVEPWFVGAEVKRKMITKRSEKSWAICSQPQVQMEWVTAILYVLHKMDTAGYSCRLHGLPTILRFGSSWSDGVCLLTGINLCERPPKSCCCEI